MLTLTFTPTDEGQFYGSMEFNPTDNMTQEVEQFYITLGHGLLTYATQDTTEVCKRGIEVLNTLMMEEQRATAANDTLDKAFDLVQSTDDVLSDTVVN